MVKELEELTDRLEEASGATAAQMELNKKREMEVGRMRKDLEEASIQQESTMLSLRKKHQDAISEMSEQIEQLNKMKQKIEKEKHAKRLQIDEISPCRDTQKEQETVATWFCRRPCLSGHTGSGFLGSGGLRFVHFGS